MKRGMSFAILAGFLVVSMVAISLKDYAQGFDFDFEDEQTANDIPGVGTLSAHDLTGEVDLRDGIDPYMQDPPLSMLPLGCRLSGGTWHYDPNYIGCSNVNLIQLNNLLGTNLTEGDIIAACLSDPSQAVRIRCQAMGGQFICNPLELSCKS